MHLRFHDLFCNSWGILNGHLVLLVSPLPHHSIFAINNSSLICFLHWCISPGTSVGVGYIIVQQFADPIPKVRSYAFYTGRFARVILSQLWLLLSAAVKETEWKWINTDVFAGNKWHSRNRCFEKLLLLEHMMLNGHSDLNTREIITHDGVCIQQWQMDPQF